MKYKLLYIDGANYKFVVTAKINKEIELGGEVTMEELGYTQKEFFDEHIHYPIDPEVDHNILVVVDHLPDTEDVDIE